MDQWVVGKCFKRKVGCTNQRMKGRIKTQKQACLCFSWRYYDLEAICGSCQTSNQLVILPTNDCCFVDLSVLTERQ